MKKPNENDILETALSIAEKGYPEAYQFLLNAYEESTSSFGPQTFYFLACLAGGANMPDLALAWLRKAIQENNWWYRPEVLEDDDLAALKSDAEFLLLKAISDDRYAAALSKAKAIFSWKKKRADNLFLAIHGNAQNGDIARADWESWEQVVCGSWKPSRVPNRTAMEPIVGAMTALPICRWRIPWKG